MPDWSSCYAALRDAGIEIDTTATPRAVGGGDISDAWRVRARDGDIFLKTGPVDSADMFAAEAIGLAEIAASDTVRVPGAIGTGVAGPLAWIALEWLDMQSGNAESEALLGASLAAMHRVTSAAHGWQRDNTIGATPQVNTQCNEWWRFWQDHRLGAQLDLAARYGYTGRVQSLGRELMASTQAFFSGHEPSPALLHGDLWGGNQARIGDEPVIFDPAVYYGDRETDLAMTRLFGGFGAGFYAAYEAAWPLPAGHENRLPMYQLYHVLNHLNLFGRSYLGRSEALMERLLAG